MMKQKRICVLSLIALTYFAGCRISHENAGETERITHSVNKNDAETGIEDKSLAISPQRPERRMRQTDLEKSVRQCLEDFNAIRPGMTRQQVEEKFLMDGGLRGAGLVRFIHPDCYYFKVDVTFSFERNAADQNRAIRSPTDVVVEVSRPYVDYPVMN